MSRQQKHMIPEFEGQRWYLRNGRYQSLDGTRLLHRAVYEHHHGPIPDGIDIHHIDGDPTNNHIDNLAAVTKSDHAKIHGQAEIMRQANLTLPHTDYTCRWCGYVGTSPSPRRQYCSESCRKRFQRRRLS